MRSLCSSYWRRPVSRAGLGPDLRRDDDKSIAPSCACPRKPGFAAGAGQCADAPDIGGALGDADHPARVEQVEDMARFEALVVGRERQRRPVTRVVAEAEQRPAFLFGVDKMPEQHLGVGAFEVVSRELALGAQEYVAVADAPRPLDTVEVE